MLLTQLLIKSAVSKDCDKFIGEIKITNNFDSSGDTKFSDHIVGNYDVIYKGVHYKNLVTGFDRRERAWKLLRLVLNELEKRGVL